MNTRRKMQSLYRMALSASTMSILALEAFLIGCTRTPAPGSANGNAGAAPSAASATAAPESPASLSKLHFVGRVAFTPSGQAQYAWSGAGFRVRFSGTGLIVQMDDAGRYHSVVVDGELRARLETQSGLTRYTVVDKLAPGEHTLELYRRTEPLVGMTTVFAVEAIGGQILEFRAAHERTIEIVGDSITCGYGDEGTDTSCHFTPATENHYFSYASLLARHFNAEVSTVAWSGRGVVKNYNGGPGDHMPELYKRILPEQPEAVKGLRPSADLVIVNLGTNDFSTEPDPSETTFTQAYVGLLADIRRSSPKALIVTTIGPMLGASDLERAERCIRNAVEQRVRAGDSAVVYHKMQTTNDNPGCDWHPSLKTHERMARELEKTVSQILKWSAEG